MNLEHPERAMSLSDMYCLRYAADKVVVGVVGNMRIPAAIDGNEGRQIVHG